MANETLHDGLPPLLDAANLANGAAFEMLGESFKRVAANISDVNTNPTQKRRIILTIDVMPYKDRSGAELSVKVDTKLSGLKAADGMMYIARRGGEFLAFGRNTKQEEIEFGMAEEDPALDGKSRSAN